MALSFIVPGKTVAQGKVEFDNTVKIGLLIQDSSYSSAVQGAETAVTIANRKAGLNGRHFQLVTRSMEGPWGTGSKQAVNLIFEEKVWALLGSHDGRNAHLVEQAATRTTVVFLSAWAGDPTLAQAFVPWFYNCLPNDLQQAKALVSEICDRKQINKVAVISDNDYDSRSALSHFLREAGTRKKAEVVQFLFEDYGMNINGLIDKIKAADTRCIILFCKPLVSLDLFRKIRKSKINNLVYGSLFLLNEDQLSDQELKSYDDDLHVPAGIWDTSQSSAFRKEYQEHYGRHPGMLAAYAFDGMNVLIEGIRKAGTRDREKIQKALSGLNYQGVTGNIHFDSRGNRSDIPAIVKLKNGIPAQYLSGNN